MKHIMRDESGVRTFECILLITLLVIGIIGGVAVIRDALIIESAETAGAIVGLSQDYAATGPWNIEVSDSKGVEVKMTETTGNKSAFSDAPGKMRMVQLATTGLGGGASMIEEDEDEDGDTSDAGVGAGTDSGD